MLGFMTEHGPYIIEDGDTKFTVNKFAWNREVSVVYIESPAGVGFSYCTTAAECRFDDNTSADENLAAILYLFKNKF